MQLSANNIPLLSPAGTSLKPPSPMPPSPWDDVRSAFPTLQREVAGNPLTYLDCAATSLRPSRVIDAGCDFCRLHDGNPHRGMHALSHEATEAYERSREKVAQWIEAPATDSIVFTRNATAAINLVAGGIARGITAADNIVVSKMEHHANLIPWQQLCKRTGATLRMIDLTSDGSLDLDSLEQQLDTRTKVVALTYVSNVLGTINPVAQVAQLAHTRNALVLIDAAQAVGHMPVSFKETGADFLVFSAHKCYGPAGLGFLVGQEDALAQLEPTEYGGDMIEYVTFEDATWADIPQRFEAGTANSQATAAFPETIDFINHLGLDRIRQHDIFIASYALERLSQLEHLRILGPLNPTMRGGLVSFYDPIVPPHDMATILDSEGIAVRAGHHCAQPLHRYLGIPASTRASFGVYTLPSDIDRLVDGIYHARKLFTR